MYTYIYHGRTRGSRYVTRDSRRYSILCWDILPTQSPNRLVVYTPLSNHLWRQWWWWRWWWCCCFCLVSSSIFVWSIRWRFLMYGVLYARLLFGCIAPDHVQQQICSGNQWCREGGLCSTAPVPHRVSKPVESTIYKCAINWCSFGDAMKLLEMLS